MAVTIIAHRCGPDIYPEQTMASAHHALSLGADVVEMDIQYTSDGIPVICHDPNARRIFGVDCNVSDMPSDQFMMLRHVADRTYPSHMLDDVLSAGIAPILFHCKFSGPRIANVVEHLTAFGYGDKAIMGVLLPEDVRTVKDCNPSIATLAFMNIVDNIDAFVSAGVDIIRLWELWVTKALINRIHASGKKVWIMAYDLTQDKVGYTSAENLRSWVDMGVDGVLINEVVWARKALGLESV